MFERFTKRARAVVTAAVEVSQASGATDVRPEHLLLAIVDDAECLAARVLDGLGAAPDAVRAELERRRGRLVGGLQEGDAEALASIGIDLEEVMRHLEARTARAVGGRGSASR